MSGRFDGLPVGGPGEGSYEPGLLGFDQALIDEVMRWHSAGGYEGGISSPQEFEKNVASLSAVIGDIPGDFKCQAFIDGLVSSLASRSEDMSAITALFSPLIQHFYNQGRNSFSLDLCALEQDSYWNMLGNLHGTEYAPLEVSLRVRGGIYHCGPYTSGCRFAIQGDVNILGLDASRCEFIFTPESSLATINRETCPTGFGGYEVMTWPCMLGIQSKQCVFRLPGYCDAYVRNGAGEFDDMSIALTKEDGTADLCEVTHRFFADGNRLIVADGAGGWTEVRP